MRIYGPRLQLFRHTAHGDRPMKIPFSIYDFFGYLASGFLLCVALDYCLDANWLMRDKPPVAHMAFWIVAAYIVGHINANLSSWVLEERLVGSLLGRPNTNLFGVAPETKGWLRKRLQHWLPTVFRGYFVPLPKRVQERISDRATVEGKPLEGEALFHHVRTLTKRDQVTWGNVQSFFHLYGFCRNISFALLLTTLLLAAHGCWALVAVSLIGSVGMLYRYLKFYRQYSYEMFTAYPDLPN